MTLSSRQLRMILAFAGLNVVLVAGGWYGLIGPQQNNAAAFNGQTQVAQTKLAQLMSGGTHEPTKQPVINTACLYKLDTALPAQEDQAGLLFELQRVAQAAGVRITGISPQAAQAMPEGYTVLPINLQIIGGFYALTRFLHDLRALVPTRPGCPNAKGPLFSVTSVSLSPQTNGDAPANVTIQTFYYGVAAGAAPPVNTTATDTTTTDTTTTTTTGS